MNIRKTSVAAVMSSTNTVQTALATGSVLEFSPGTLICVGKGTTPYNLKIRTVFTQGINICKFIRQSRLKFSPHYRYYYLITKD